MRWGALINRLKPAIPCIYLYDKGGQQSFTSAGEFHIWDTKKIGTSHFSYEEDTDSVFLNTESSGLFMLEFDCSFTSHEEDIASIECSVWKNGAQLEGTEAYTTVTINYDYSISLHTIVYLEKGDYIQIRSQTNQIAAITSIGETSRLIITYIPMLGWNNSSSGRVDYKGGVMR